MLILLNSTKTMDMTGEVSCRLVPTEPEHLDAARQLAGPLAKVSLSRLSHLMGVKGKLADQTPADLAMWGRPGRIQKPALEPAADRGGQCRAENR